MKDNPLEDLEDRIIVTGGKLGFLPAKQEYRADVTKYLSSKDDLLYSFDRDSFERYLFNSEAFSNFVLRRNGKAFVSARALFSYHPIRQGLVSQGLRYQKILDFCDNKIGIHNTVAFLFEDAHSTDYALRELFNEDKTKEKNFGEIAYDIALEEKFIKKFNSKKREAVRKRKGGEIFYDIAWKPKNSSGWPSAFSRGCFCVIDRSKWRNDQY
ncbi:MAG: hypothetical protein KKF50_01830 [Nanoarchaeota archaeon]|nr:hypothetical protein [Nanoarchaeota archaeon]